MRGIHKTNRRNPNGAAYPSACRTRACHALFGRLSSRRVPCRSRAPESQGPARTVVRPPPRFSWHEAFARSPGVGHGGTCPPSFGSWLVSGAVLARFLSAKGLGAQRRRHAGAASCAGSRYSSSARPGRGTDRGRAPAPTRPVPRHGHAPAARGGVCSSRSLADPWIDLSIPRRGVGRPWPSPVRSGI